MQIRILLEPQIRELIGPPAALREVRAAFIKLARGEATLPGVINLDLSEHRGEVHVKSAYLKDSPYYSVKQAAGFYGNPERGLPVGSGVILVFDAYKGFLRAILFDNGYLTELRTGAAGALAADLLAKRTIDRVGVLGCGVQARYQLAALVGVRWPGSVAVYGRSQDRVREYIREMEAMLGIPVRAAQTIREAVEGSDILITATPAREPIVHAEWVLPGTHITAVGADGPEKQELEVDVLAKADKVVADRFYQCVRLGEIHHAVDAGVLSPDAVFAELGEIAAGIKPGRTKDREITVADLTGVGIQDAAVADFVMGEANRHGVGQTMEV